MIIINEIQKVKMRIWKDKKNLAYNLLLGHYYHKRKAYDNITNKKIKNELRSDAYKYGIQCN